MSTLIVPVAEIEAINPHPNADKLELATVMNWQTIVLKGKYQPGDKVVYFPIDTILPREVAERFEVEKYLHNGRIRAAKLRGTKSFGLVITPDDSTWEVGQNVAEHYGAIKYEPAQKQLGGGRTRPETTGFDRYPDLENIRYYSHIFEDGEPIIAVEKIHGTNSRVGYVKSEHGWEFMAGSRRLRRAEPLAFAEKAEQHVFDTATEVGMARVTEEGLHQYLTDFAETYWKPLQLNSVRELLIALSENCHLYGILADGEQVQSVVLYGEIYGSGVQSLDYGQLGAEGYVAFDIAVNGKFLDFHAFDFITWMYGVPTAPVVYEGPFNIDTLRLASEGPTLLGSGKHIREGVVVRPEKERWDSRLGRVVTKFVGDEYLLSKKVSDSTDV